MLDNNAVKYLDDFIVLAEIGNYERAADILYLSKSALNKHIKTLETYVGLPLFANSGHRLVLTEAGRFFLDYARRFTDLDEEFENALTKFKQDCNNEVRVAVSSFMNCDHMVNMLWDHFSSSHPECHLITDEYHIDYLNPDHLFAMGYEIVFSVSSSPDNSKYHTFTWASCDLDAILPLDHPLASHKSVQLSELKDETFILVPIGTWMYTYIVALCQKAGFNPHVCFTIQGSSSMAELISASLGVSIAADNELHAPQLLSRVAVIPLDPAVSVYLNLYYQKDRPMTPAAASFLNYMLQIHETHEKDIPFYGPEVGVENIFF